MTTVNKKRCVSGKVICFLLHRSHFWYNRRHILPHRTAIVFFATYDNQCYKLLQPMSHPTTTNLAFCYIARPSHFCYNQRHSPQHHKLLQPAARGSAMAQRWELFFRIDARICWNGASKREVSRTSCDIGRERRPSQPKHLLAFLWETTICFEINVIYIFIYRRIWHYPSKSFPENNYKQVIYRWASSLLKLGCDSLY